MILTFLTWSRPIPSLFDASKLSRLARILGFLCKSLPRLIVFLHYLVLLVLLIMLGQVAGNKCGLSVRSITEGATVDLSKKETYEVTQVQGEAAVLVGVLSVMWVVMHVGGWIAKSLIYVDPYIVEPWDPNRGKILRVICISCGP